MCKAKESQHWLCPFIPGNGILKSQTISNFTSGKIQVYVIDIGNVGNSNKKAHSITQYKLSKQDNYKQKYRKDNA